MMDTRHRLRRGLQDAASALHLPEAGPAAVRQRARRRARRRQAGVAGVTAAALTVAGAAVWRALGPARDVAFDGSQGTTAAADPRAFEWREGETVIHAASHRLVGADGLYYLLSTAPGPADPGVGEPPVQALYRSADGLTWDTTVIDGTHRVIDLDERGGVLYALSTAPGTGGTVTEWISASADGGRDWQRMELPSAEPPDATVRLGRSWTGHIAASDEVLVAVVQKHYRFDEREVFDESELAGRRVLRSTEEGVALVAVECDDMPDEPIHAGAEATTEHPCAEGPVIRTVPWSELGLAGRHELSTTAVFLSTDGASWERVAGSPLPGVLRDLVAVGDAGFVALTSPGGDGTTMRVLRSTDGRDWRPLEPSPEWLQVHGAVGSRLVATGHVGDPATLLVSDDGARSWSGVSLSALVDVGGDDGELSVHGISTGPLGVAALASAHHADGSASSYLLTSPDALRWGATPLAEITGEEDAPVGSWTAVGADSIILRAAWGTGPGDVERHTYTGTPTR